MFFYICLHFYAESSIKQKKNQNKPHLITVMAHKILLYSVISVEPKEISF